MGRPGALESQQRVLPLRVVYALASLGEILRVALDTDERFAHSHRGDSGSAATHECIANRVRIWREADAPLHEVQGLLCRVQTHFYARLVAVD